MWDVTDVLSTIFAVGALLLQIVLALLLVLAVASLFSAGARGVLVEIRETLLGSELWIAWAVAAVATLGSLYFSEIAHYIPCRLCWFQRIGMYPLAVILLVAAVRRDARGVFPYAIALPVVGLLVSLYHIAVEIWPSLETQGCKVGGASCTVKWIDELGYVTIPVLAATAFATIIALLLFARSRDRAGAS
jgi:disulfide bond formation protein DsbB